MLERDYVRIYTGDTRIREQNGKILGTKQKDIIFGDETLYQTLNAIMYEGITNEQARIKEGIKLNVELLKEPRKIVEIMENIYSAILNQGKLQNETITYRLTRFESVEQLQECGYTKSFFSTKKRGFDPVFAKKKNLVEMRVKIERGVYCADLQRMLKGEYWMDEQEILIPPFTPIFIEEVRDRKNRFKGSFTYEAVVKPQQKGVKSDEEKIKELEQVISGELLEKAAKVLRKMNAAEADLKQVEEYICWKRNLQDLIKMKLIDKLNAVESNS